MTNSQPENTRRGKGWSEFHTLAELMGGGIGEDVALADGSSVELVSDTPSKKEEIKNTSAEEKERGAEDLLDVSRGHIEVITPKIDIAPREVDISSAREALIEDISGAQIDILPEGVHDSGNPAISSEEKKLVFETVLEQGASNEREERPAEKNPIDAATQKIDGKLKASASALHHEIKNLDQEQVRKLEEGIIDLSQRIAEVKEMREKISDDELLNKLQALSEEVATVGSKEWKERFIEKENSSAGTTTELAPTEIRIPQIVEKKNETKKPLEEKIPAEVGIPKPEKEEGVFVDAEPIKTEAEQETVTETEAMAQFENLPPEQKLTFFQNIAKIGFTVEKKKNELFAGAFGWLAGDEKTYARDKTLQRFFDSTKEIFERDAKRSEQSLADLTAGKETKLQLFGKDIVDIKTLRGSGFLWGNMMKYGRSILGPFAWVNTGLMAANIGFEAGKEARLANEDVIKKTRIQDIDQAEESARRIYQEAKEKAGAGNPVSKETLEKAYQEGIPKDLLERLAKNIAPGVENSFWQKVLQKGMRETVEKISHELAKIDADENLSSEARDSQKDAYLNNWFARSQRLKDFDRIVSQNGEIDELASLSRYGEVAAKTAVYLMMADSMRRIGMKLAEFFSSSDGVEIIAGSVPTADTQTKIVSSHTPNTDNAFLENALPNTDTLPKNTLADDILSKLKFAKNYELPADNTTQNIQNTDSLSAEMTPKTEVSVSQIEAAKTNLEEIYKKLGIDNPKILNEIKNLEKTYENAITDNPLSPAKTEMPLAHQTVPTTINNEGTLIPEAAKVPESVLPEPKMGFSSIQEGTVVPEAVKIPENFFQAPAEHLAPNTAGHEETFIPKDGWMFGPRGTPSTHGIAETLTPRQFAIEQSLAELGKTHMVIKGDTLWSITKSELGGNDYWKQLGATAEGVRQQNFILDTMRHDLLNRSREDLIAMGIKSGDINRIYPGDKINLSGVFNKDELTRIFNRAEHLQTLSHSPIADADVVPTTTAPKIPELIAPTSGNFNAFSAHIEDVPSYEEYRNMVYQEIHLRHPQIELPFYYMSMRDFLHENPNGMKELDGIFQMNEVEIPSKLPEETLNDSVLKFWTRQAIQDDFNHRGGHILVNKDELGQENMLLAPKALDTIDLEGFKTSLESWGTLPNGIKKYIVTIDGQMGRNIDHAVWEKMRAMPTKDVLENADNSSLRNRLLFLQTKVDVENHPDLKITLNEKLEHYIARLTQNLWMIAPNTLPEIPKDL